MNTNPVYVAVHGGAGVHNSSLDGDIKRALRRACTKALNALVEQSSSLSAVEDGISVLEDDSCLNAGYGSNLTLDGQVECDAALMDARTGDFGSVGAVAAVKNPIRLARAVLDHARKPDALGRMPPLTLVSNGARAFAASVLPPNSAQVQLLHPESLIFPGAKKEWEKWISMLDRPCDDAGTPTGLHNVQDTVGAVAWDDEGGMAAGVSSGGLLLKYPGRIGEAAVFGAGCWAQQSSECASQGMACSVSGLGEHIIRYPLARTIGEELLLGKKDTDLDTHAILQRVFNEGFWRPCKERGEGRPDAGILMLMKEDDGKGGTVPRLWCAFTTASMAIAYASSTTPKPKTLILRRPLEHATHRGPSLFITAFSL